MLFKKLFQLLVVGGAMVGTGAGCAGVAQSQEASEKKAEDRDGGGASADGGTAKAQDGDGGAAADAGGGGVVGW
jgi:hypothetical protein